MGLSSPVNLTDTSLPDGVQCAFVRVREATGVPECVDATVRSVTEIQFDNTGGVYYRGVSNGSQATLRRYKDGSVRDLITANATISRYAVMTDGSVVMAGNSTGGSAWTRRLSPTLELSNIFPDAAASWLALFPDGNVYFGVSTNQQWGIYRFMADSKTLDPTPWVNSRWDRNASGYFVLAPGADGPCKAQAVRDRHPNVCNGGFATNVGNLTITQGGVVYALASNGGGGDLVQLWPEFKLANTSVTGITKMTAADSSFVLAGTNATGQNITVVFDPTTESDRVLIPAASQTEIYNLAYSASTGEVFFDGLRFSNNTYVVGKVNVSSGAITYLGTTLTSFSDFQAF